MTASKKNFTNFYRASISAELTLVSESAKLASSLECRSWSGNIFCKMHTIFLAYFVNIVILTFQPQNLISSSLYQLPRFTSVKS